MGIVNLSVQTIYAPDMLATVLLGVYALSMQSQRVWRL
jgi:hypothetical protein